MQERRNSRLAEITIDRADAQAASREEAIVDRATQFFADHGLHGNTRDLARSIGVSQPLLYHYFPSKDALIARVVDRLFEDRWKPEWRDGLRRADLSLRQRLEQFCIDYAETILTRDWTRILFFASLAGMDVHKRHQAVLRERALRPIARELRREFGSSRPEGVSTADLELAQRLHTAVFQVAVRRWVFDQPPARSQAVAIREEVAFFLHGARSQLGERLGNGQGLKLAVG
ncbi:TetR/AcrR family transcriptional regulator [Stella sp.]|uniref:TetR/AcrR family transcriptional regulator n=1 Tax=Stella sp. TaxID=2912054 RepID=UPI0035B4D274